MADRSSLVPDQMWRYPAGVVEWLTRYGQQVRAPIEITRVGGGQSNITTVIVDADGRQWVMREPPPGEAASAAHDIEREARILRSLAASGVPVPRVVGTGHGPVGVPFLVMEKVAGVALEMEGDARTLDLNSRRRLGLSVAATLARLHRLDPGILGIPVSTIPYVVQQLRRLTAAWERHGEGSKHAGEWRALRARLEVRAPAAPAPVIVHGDYRLSNLLVGNGVITAVLDWELCTIGDPLADLAWLLDDWRPPEEPAIVMPSPTRAGGFPDRDEMVGVYRELTGFNLDALDYYRAFSQWRAASLLQGVLVRRRRGAMGTHAAVGCDELDHSIGVLLASAGACLA